MRTWLIGGSSSGVGKSTFVKNLVDLLPNSNFLKLGHGACKKDGPENYFTETEKALQYIADCDGKYENFIAEATRLVGKFDADVVIFLNSKKGNRRNDADERMKSANIILGNDSNPWQWVEYLESLDLLSGTRRKVHDLLRTQHEFISGSDISIRAKIWFVRGNRNVFGEGLSRLLESIDRYGSLSKAAKIEGISYRHAWGDIKKAEENLGFKLIDRTTGGLKGGGSKLTPNAYKLVEGYKRIKRKVIMESDKQFLKILDVLDKDSE
jgi:molybdate transport system regulatory protein